MVEQYLGGLLGGDRESLLEQLASVDELRRGDGQSMFFSVVEARSSELQLPLEKLAEYDLNVLEYETEFARRRVGFRFRYFQWLAGIHTECSLDQVKNDPAQLLRTLEHRRQEFEAGLPPYEAVDLRKLAYWMATGAGKTLILHMNLLQFRRYRLFEPANVLVLAPTATLALQHCDELRLSGIECDYALDAPSIFGGVQVIDMPKLYIEGVGSRPRKGGVSIPVSQFEGPNLLFVDEGHKGGTSQGDKREDQAWRAVRAALSRDGGFTFEYSATFAQVTEGDDTLHDEYTRSIISEFAYARFHAEGFGKSFNVVNLRDADSYGDELLLAGLLTYYEQLCLFEERGSEFSEYHIARPLQAFVGAQVNAGPEVLQIIDFLNRVLTDSSWAEGHIALLLRGRSGLLNDAETDIFADAFPYLRHVGGSARTVYGDLVHRLFGGRGALTLHLLSRAHGEIALRPSDAARDAYCGVINVGEAGAFLDRVIVETSTGLVVGSPDVLTESLFTSIERVDSPVRFLVGSKKFIEGWSSWRVSVMALLKVGSRAGAQVLQLFGRGVRLRGRDLGLKRSSALPGTHPQFLSLLEELSVFGLRANYLKTFLDGLRVEGVEPKELRTLPLSFAKTFVPLGLQSLEVDPSFEFEDQVLTFDASETDALVDVSLRAQAGGAGGLTAARATFTKQVLPGE